MANSTFEVYVITNQCNNMKYVGVTCRGVDLRWKEHLYSAYESNSQAPIHIAIREYGKSNFTVELVKSNVTPEDARSEEKLFIQKFNSEEPYGYNTYKGGMGGHHHTPEGKNNISNGLKGHIFSESRNQKVREAMKQREYKQEWSDKLSEVRKGKYTKELNKFYGKHHTEESKMKKKASQLLSAGKIIQCHVTDSDTVLEFDSFKDAGEYVMDHGLAKTSVLTCSDRISRNCKKKSPKPFYGGIWKFKERSID